MPTNKKGVSESDTTNTENTTITEKSNTVNSETAKETEQPHTKARNDGVTNFAYVGPSLPGGRLKSLSTLNGTYTQIIDYYKDAIAQFPNVARLIVPIAYLAESHEKTQTSGNLLHKYYHDIAAAINAKGDKQ